MIRIISKWWAKPSYLWSLEVEGHKNLINAATAKRNADDKRKLVEQLNAEADAIEKNVKEYAEKEEKGFWLCENGHETGDGIQPPPENRIPNCPDCGKTREVHQT